jgi:hypothetical protein
MSSAALHKSAVASGARAARSCKRKMKHAIINNNELAQARGFLGKKL